MAERKAKGAGARTRARELMVQALYQKQIAGHSTSELVSKSPMNASINPTSTSSFLPLAIRRMSLRKRLMS